MAEDNKQCNPQRAQFDPGWNDPPIMQFNPTAQGTNKTKLNLSKRIAFPLNNTAKPTAIVQPSQVGLSLTQVPTQSSPLPVAIVNPMQHPPQPTNSVPPLDSNNIVPGNDYEFTNENEIRDFCLNTFQSHLGNVIESTHVRTDEIQRRLNILSQMWLNNQLNTSMHKELFCIAKALQTHNFNAAIENHRILVVNHSNICMQWAPALRQIILTIKPEGVVSIADAPSTILCGTSFGNILNPAVNAMIYSDNTEMQALFSSETQSDSASNVQNM